MGDRRVPQLRARPEEACRGIAVQGDQPGHLQAVTVLFAVHVGPVSIGGDRQGSGPSIHCVPTAIGHEPNDAVDASEQLAVVSRGYPSWGSATSSVIIHSRDLHHNVIEALPRYCETHGASAKPDVLNAAIQSVPILSTMLQSNSLDTKVLVTRSVEGVASETYKPSSIHRSAAMEVWPLRGVCRRRRPCAVLYRRYASVLCR